MKNKSILKKLKERDRKTRKKIVIDATLELFEKHTVLETSMRDISEATGFTVSSLYTYFPNQKALYCEAALHLISALGPEGKDSSFIKGSSAMETLAVSMADRLLTHKSALRMIGLLILDPEMPDYLEDTFKHIKTRIFDIVNQSLSESGITDHGTETSYAFFASILGTILFYDHYDDQNDAQNNEELVTIVRHISRIFQSAYSQKQNDSVEPIKKKKRQ